MGKAFFFISFLLLLLHFSKGSTANQNPDSQNPSYMLSSAHNELRKNGFPIGLLPTNVLDYTLNRSSGDFAVNLGDLCKVTLPPDNYLATYRKKITGKLVVGRIAELEGIRVRALFKWWSITGIKLNGEDLVFEVGMVKAKFPSKKFDETPACEGQRSSS